MPLHVHVHVHVHVLVMDDAGLLYDCLTVSHEMRKGRLFRITALKVSKVKYLKYSHAYPSNEESNVKTV